MALLNRKQFAGLLDVTPPYIGKLLDAGMPVNRTGKKGAAISIDSKKAIDWLIEREVAKHRARSIGDVSMAEADRLTQIARARKLTAEADMIEDQVVSIEHVERVFSEACVQYRTGAESLAGRLAGQLVGVDSAAEIRRRILAEARRTADGAATALEAFIAAEESAALTATAAGADGVAVGGSQTDTAEG